MELTTKLLEDMKAKQKVLNDRFTNLPVTREVEIPLTVFMERKVTGISHTEVVELNDGIIELRRFIDRKLYKMTFTKGISITGLIKVLGTDDELYMKGCI